MSSGTKRPRSPTAGSYAPKKIKNTLQPHPQISSSKVDSLSKKKASNASVGHVENYRATFDNSAAVFNAKSKDKSSTL
jgi:hypothetical protein